MNKFILIMFLLVSSRSNSQDINTVILDKMANMPVDIPDLSFSYCGIDTMKGIELVYIDKSDSKCRPHLFFIENIDKKDIDKYSSVYDLLRRSDKYYHYMSFSIYSSFFRCEYNDIDTFEICKNENAYGNAIGNIIGDSRYYRLDKNRFFAVNEVKIILYKFKSKNVKYKYFFYHFIDRNIDEMVKLVYKNILCRKKIIKNHLLNAPLYKVKDMECMSVYR